MNTRRLLCAFGLILMITIPKISLAQEFSAEADRLCKEQCSDYGLFVLVPDGEEMTVQPTEAGIIFHRHSKVNSMEWVTVPLPWREGYSWVGEASVIYNGGKIAVKVDNEAENLLVLATVAQLDQVIVFPAVERNFDVKGKPLAVIRLTWTEKNSHLTPYTEAEPSSLSGLVLSRPPTRALPPTQAVRHCADCSDWWGMYLDGHAGPHADGIHIATLVADDFNAKPAEKGDKLVPTLKCTAKSCETPFEAERRVEKAKNKKAK